MSRWSIPLLVVVAAIAGAGIVLAQNNFGVDAGTVTGGGGTSSGGSYAVGGTVGQPVTGRAGSGAHAISSGFWPVVAADIATATPTPTTTGGPAVAVATIAATPGAKQVVPIPDTQGDVVVPGDVAGSTPVQVEIRLVTAPAGVPTAVTVLLAVEVSFARVSDGARLIDLDQDVLLEISYAGLGLTDDQIGRLVVYNATRGQYLPTRIDAGRQVAIASTRRFSVFALVQVTAPIPRVYLPVSLKSRTVGW